MKRFVFLLALLFVPSRSSWSLSLSDIRSQVRINVRDPNDGNQRYSDATINALANEGQKQIVNLTWLAEKTTSYVLTAGVTYYNLPTDLLGIKQVYFKEARGQTLNLEEKQQRSLYQQNPDWERFFSEPTQYWVRYATSSQPSSVSPWQIAYLPIAQNTSTGTVTIWYYCEATDLSSDSDIPFNGIRQLYSYHQALVYYVTLRIMQIDGIEDEAKAYGDLFTGYVATIKDRVGRAPNYNPSFGSK